MLIDEATEELYENWGNSPLISLRLTARAKEDIVSDVGRYLDQLMDEEQTRRNMYGYYNL